MSRVVVFVLLVAYWLPDAVAGTQVYECKVEGRRIFSDQPCAGDARQREIGESNRMDAQPVSSIKADSPTRKRRVDDSSDKDDLIASCNRIREQRADIVNQERAGYTVKQGEKLRERRNKLDEKYRVQRCERYR
jgi:hypothetical protein